MQNNNVLQIPFRRTQALRLSEAIRDYIANTYDQHPDTFTSDLEAIDELRREACHAVEPHESGVKRIQAYAAQLVWLGGKFPDEVGAEFTWYPSLGYNHHGHPQVEKNMRFELASILFNLVAMYSQLGISANRATGDGLKNAASNFCLAAGVINHLKTAVIPDLGLNPPEDMDSATLEALEALMLAQAQECFWAKAVKDGFKDGLIAKLAAKVSDLYREANDWSIKSDSVRSEWIHHINAKHFHFAAAAQYRAACDCLEKRKYGEEVARLRDSLVCVNQALSEARHINKTVLDDLNGLKTRVSEDLKRAEKDNDTIYLQPEPTKSELKILDRTSMVSAKTPPQVSDPQGRLGEHGELGRPLFTKLVPYSVHIAASLYSARRDNLVNNDIISELETLTQRIHELLSSLNLPGALQALEKPLGLPPSLASHAEELRQSEGVHRLHATIADTDKLKANNRAMYQEGLDLLRTEAGEDEAARRKYGTERWTRLSSKDAVPKLYNQVTEIDGYLKQADQSDKTVHKKLRDNEGLIRLLGGSSRDLEDFVPSSRRHTVTAKLERETTTLQTALNEVSRLENRRRKKIEALRQKAREDDVQPELIQETARLERQFPLQPVQSSQFEHLFAERLRQYDVDKQDVQNEDSEQRRLMHRVTDANIGFQSAKRGDASTTERENALQKLENAYTAYKEIVRDLETGRSFYNRLSPITIAFRDECRRFAYTRRSEGQSVEADVATAMANLQLQHTTQQTLLSERAAQQQQQRHVPPPARMVAEPLAAPTPQRPQAQPPIVAAVQSPQPAPAAAAQAVWQEGMPIVFGNSAAATKGSTGAKAKANGASSSDDRWDPSKGVQFR